MKAMLIGIAAAAVILSGCSGGGNTPNDTTDTNTKVANPATPSTSQLYATYTSPQQIITSYMSVKNALVNDNGADAAAAGKQLSEIIGKLDTTTMTAAQQQVYNDVSDDIKEQAEHIGASADKLAHQRKHFHMLSKDVYDLTEALQTSGSLYVDFCPMYNSGKGAIWLSETKEIRNPYYGQKMVSCGNIKKEAGK